MTALTIWGFEKGSRIQGLAGLTGFLVIGLAYSNMGV
jgi:hypothetical protein